MTIAIHTLLAIGISYALTLLARHLAPRWGVLDHPDGQRKKHQKATPLMGGVAIYLTFAGVVGVAYLFGADWIHDPTTLRFSRSLLVSGGLLCAVGLIDDKFGMRARTKFLLQIAASTPFAMWSTSVETVHLFHFAIPLGSWGTLFTLFWLVACTNVINLVDGLDGLAGTIGLIVCVSAAGLLQQRGLVGLGVLSMIFSGGVIGFLIHNWPPAKIFLGDAGSLLIGFMVGAFSVESSMKTATGFALAVPLVLVSVPVFDTSLAILRRKLRGKNIGEADRGHIHHRLQDQGLTGRQSLIVITSVCLFMAAASLAGDVFESDLLAIFMCVAAFGFLILARVFGYLETQLVWKHIGAIGQTLVASSGVLRTHIALARVSYNGDASNSDYWTHMVRCVRNMGGQYVECCRIDVKSGEVVNRLEWKGDEAEENGQAKWQICYTVPTDAQYQSTISATGHRKNKLRQQRMMDLFHLFDDFCRTWSQDENISEMPLEHHVLPIPAASEAEAGENSEFDLNDQQDGDRRVA